MADRDMVYLFILCFAFILKLIFNLQWDKLVNLNAYTFIRCNGIVQYSFIKTVFYIVITNFNIKLT